MSERVFWSISIATTMLILGGCSAQPGQVTGAEARLLAAESQPAFLDRISSQRDLSENDAMRGVLFLVDGKDEFQTFQQRVSALRAKSVVDPSWDCQATRPLSRGRLAYMIYQACGMKGGVILSLAGPSPRYCLRELEYHKMMSPGLPNTEVTGMEYVAVLGRASLYQQTGQYPD